MSVVLWLALALSIAGASAFAQQAVPDTFTASERWANYLHRTYAPERLAYLAADSAMDHAMREPACWDYTAESYGMRFARSMGRRMIRNTTELAGGLLTGEDLRYRPSSSHHMADRVWNALRSAVTARMPDGSRRPAYTRFFATTATDLATAHWVNSPIQPGWMAQSFAWSVVGQAETNLLDEFQPDFRRIGMGLWKRVRGANR